MSIGASSQGINMEPKINAHKYRQLYYVAFMIVGGFILNNFFVALVVNAFNMETNKLSGYYYLSLDQ